MVIKLRDLECEGRTVNCIVEIANRDVYKLKMGDFREETQKKLINFMIIRKKIVTLHQNNKLHLFQIIIYTLIYSLIFVR